MSTIAPDSASEPLAEAAGVRLTLYLTAGFAAGQAAQLRDGFYQPWAFCWLTLAVVAVGAALIVGREVGKGLWVPVTAIVAAALLWPAWTVIQFNCSDPYWAEQRVGGWFFLGTAVAALVGAAIVGGRLRRMGVGRWPVWVAGGMLAWQFVGLLTYRVGSEWADSHGFHAGMRFYVCIAVAMAGAACVLCRPAALRWVGMTLAVVAFAVIGHWVIEGQRPPFFDVWFAQDRGVRHFLNGHNPYTAKYEFIWDDKEAVPPGSRATQWLDGGFAYSPWTFWLDLGGYKLGGDVRYAHLACMMATAVLLAALGRGSLGKLAGLLFLFNPRAFFILESAWTEAHVAVALAGLVLVARYWPRLTGVLLGLFLASKQYLVFAIPPAVVLVRPWDSREQRLGGSLALPGPHGGGGSWLARTARMVGVAALVGSAISLPLVVWNWPALLHGDMAEVKQNVRAYLHSTFAGTAASPVHDDALSYVVWAKANLGISLPRHTSFVVALLALPLLMWRLPKAPAGYAAAVGAVYLLFFATAKFTFCGYFYFVTACFCAAASAETRRSPQV